MGEKQNMRGHVPTPGFQAFNPMVRYKPLFSFVEVLTGKELTPEHKELIIILAEKGARL